MGKNETTVSSIDKKMSIIISLLLKISNNGEGKTYKEQIRELFLFGMSSSEIADILGKKTSYVSKELSWIKKEMK